MQTSHGNMKAAVGARVNVRSLLHVNAVESYVRNFQHESHRLQELLEITLCYGIRCVARNFQLKGMTVDELYTITSKVHTDPECILRSLTSCMALKDHRTVQNSDFYVRNATKQRQTEKSEPAKDPQQLFNKPAHTWRDGESKPEILPVMPSAIEPSTGNAPEVFFLPADAQRGTVGDSLYPHK
jgi:hypothetical protein